MSNYNLYLPKTQFPLKRKAGHETRFVPEVSTLTPNPNFNYVLHDGPPYANGNLHLGHFLNKVMKDINNRYQESFHGKTVSFRPGWDCHGLPIELKVEEQYSKQKKNKLDDPLQFRKDCRVYAENWVEEQQKQFKSFGVMAEWENRYLTQNYDYEAETLKNLYALMEKGYLEQRFRPVWWSPAEKTTMAEAEFERMEMDMNSLFVEFPVDGEDYSVFVWTTTPWTLPGNQAVAYNSDSVYVMARTLSGKTLVMGESCFNYLAPTLNLEYVGLMDPSELAGKFVLPPFGGKTKLYSDNEMVLPEMGSGFLHLVPGHGFEDFEFGVKHNLNLESLVDNDGMMSVDGQLVHVFKANRAVEEYLMSNSVFCYFEPGRTKQQEVSWRSKKPLVVKTAKNWFFDFSSFKYELLHAAGAVDWAGSQYLNRFRSMLSGRAEWCLSRQRLWGVPMALFLHRETGDLLVDPEVNKHVVDLFKEHSSDVWYEHDADWFLPDQYKGQFDKVMDVLDVWFDSGSSFKAVYPELDQADLYLEGSDQHRGWFQSSALLHYALYGKLPFKSVVTHGFVTEKFQKLSKSSGNGDFLPSLVDKYGVDSLRFWVGSNTKFGDLELTSSNLDRSQQAYDKVRNTLRFCMSNLENETVNENAELRPLDRYVLSKFDDLYQSFKDNEYNVLFLVQYTNWLSNFYLSTIKDTLYCDSKTSERRQSVVLTLSKLTKVFLLLAYPVFPFLVAEARENGFEMEYCLADLDRSNLGYWEFVEDERDELLKAFEQVRQLKGWKMEEVTARFNSLLPVDWKDLLGCAKVELWDHKTINFDVDPEMKKCLRCRTYCVTTNDDELCDRCEHVESEFGDHNDSELPQATGETRT